MITSMTEEQVRDRSQKKMKMIQDLCVELKVSIVAKQRIGQDMTIEQIVVFNDTENYPIEPAITRGPVPGEDTGTVVPENAQSGPAPVVNNEPAAQ